MASLDGDRRELLAEVRGRLAAAVKGRFTAPVEKVKSGGWGFRNPRELLPLPRQMRLPEPLAEDLREVLVGDTVMKTYQERIAQLVHTSDFSYSKLDMSDGLRHQVEFMPAQLQGAKERDGMPDDKEYTALQKMMASYGGQDSQKYSEKTSVLKKIEDLVLAKNSVMGPPTASKVMDSSRDGSETIPDEVRNPKPIGQTKHGGQAYASTCIEECLASGHQVHQSTLQRTPNTTSGPDYPSSYSMTDCFNIDALLTKLCSPDLMEQKSAAAELRLLAKQNASNRLCIAEAGAIPLLLNLLSLSDLQTQAQAITALLNLSILVDNKERIISSGAVPSIVHVLMNGNMEARENAAATLVSLSLMDEYKVTIGETGAIPALVVLLSEGSQRGKKDAAHALFNLCTCVEGNKAHAVRAGLVSLIMGLLKTGALVDEAIALLRVLSSHPEGKAAIGLESLSIFLWR